MIRQLICAVLGHIDHGKSTILDKIRGTAVQSREAGGITQHIGASEVPLDVIRKVCGPLIKNINLTLPGLLFIDTPGHAAFSSLRERGGTIADIAVLVVDVNSSLQPQAIESLEILKKARVPFVIALNKIDTLGGWVPRKAYLLEDIRQQSTAVQGLLEQRLYSLVNELSSYGFNAERFDRVKDFTKEISIIPTSGITGEGIPELLMVLAGLAQRYMEKSLQVDLSKPATGTVLEVKELKGLGSTLDVIIYDGTLKEGDMIVIGGLDGPVVSKARVLLKPAPLQEMREKGEFTNVKKVVAAAGVKISGPNLENVVAGVPLIACRSDEEVRKAKEQVQSMINRVVFKTEKEGLIIKADSIGSLEALGSLFSQYPIKKAIVGHVTKKDVIEALSVKESRPELGVILAFNVKILPEAQELANDSKVRIFTGNIIYSLMDDYAEYREKVETEVKRKALSDLILPVKIRILPNHIFRSSNPAIVGVEVLGGVLKQGYPLVNEKLKQAGRVKSIRDGEEVLSEAGKGKSVAISIEAGIVGRNIAEGEILFSDVSEQHFHKMKTELKKYLTQDEVEVMRELLRIHREKDPIWGF